MVMLVAYFDESGTDRSKSTALTVAGYISTPDMWEQFRLEWQEMLDDQCLEYFHMTDLENLKKQFSPKRGWNEERKVSVLQRAHKIINENVLKDIESSLIWSDYDEIIKSYRKKNPPSAYAVLVNACLSQAGEWATKQGYNELIKYIFEKRGKGDGWVLENYKKADKDPKAIEAFRFGGISYEDKKDKRYIQLQAADVNAYESCKQMVNRVVDGEQRRQRISLANLKGQSGYVSTKYFDREGLAIYARAIEEEDI